MELVQFTAAAGSCRPSGPAIRIGIGRVLPLLVVVPMMCAANLAE
jgi:hypothetical protein